MNNPVVIVIVGLLFMAGGIAIVGMNIVRLKRCTELVSAIVTDYISKSGSKGGIVYAPVFTYYYEGTEYSSNLNYYSSSRPFKMGKEVNIKVDPNDPYYIFVPRLWGIWVFGIIFILAGTGLIYLGLYR